MRLINTRSISKDVDAVEVAKTVNGQNAKTRFFSSKKSNGEGFDLLSSVEEDDVRNDKSFASKLQRRQSKSKEERDSSTDTNNPISSYFQFNRSDSTREREPPSPKPKGESAAGESSSKFPLMRSPRDAREHSTKKEKAAAPLESAAVAPSIFHLSSSDIKTNEAAGRKLNSKRNNKKSKKTSSAKSGDVVAASSTSMFQFSPQDTSKTPEKAAPVTRKRSKDKVPVAAAGAAAMFQFTPQDISETPEKSVPVTRKRSKDKVPVVAAAAAGAAVAGVGASTLPSFFQSQTTESETASKNNSPRKLTPAIFAKNNGKANEGRSAAVVETKSEVVREGANRNPAVMAKLFPKTERKQMKIAYHHFSADAANVVVVEQDGSAPKLAAPNHVLIKVQASTVTLNDCLLRRGFDFNVLSPLSLPITPGFDVVGNIIELGSKVCTDSFAVGDRVAAMVRTGGNARYVSVPESSLVKVPSHLDSAEVVAMVSIYTTAYRALRKVSGGSPMFSLEGKKILILGGMDGVGQALIQLCKKARATIYATAPSVRHIYLKNVLGVNPLPETDWLSAVEGELDYVFDGICDAGTEKSFKALKSNGELVCYGHASMLKEREIGILGAPFSARMNQLYTKISFRVHTVDIWESFQNETSSYKQDLKTLYQLLKWNKLKPHIAKRVSLAEVAGAQAKLEKGDIRGTIVCFPWRPIRSGKITDNEDEA